MTRSLHQCSIVSRRFSLVEPIAIFMKAIIPLAGKGTRLRPHTHTTPKPLIRVAGRPVMSYIPEDLAALGLDELVFGVGYMRGPLER